MSRLIIADGDGGCSEPHRDLASQYIEEDCGLDHTFSILQSLDMYEKHYSLRKDIHDLQRSVSVPGDAIYMFLADETQQLHLLRISPINHIIIHRHHRRARTLNSAITENPERVPQEAQENTSDIVHGS